MADFLLEEEHGNDEHHGEEEDHDGELGALWKRSVTLFLRGHGDETGLHAGLEDRVLFKVDALEGGDERSDGGAEEAGRQNHAEDLAEGDAHRFNDNPHGGGGGRNRGGGNGDLGGDDGGGQRLGRTNAVLLGHFLNHVQDGHRREARAGEDRQKEGDRRSEDVDVLRIGAKNAGGNANHVVHAAGNVHDGAGEEDGHDDEDHVKGHGTRRDAEAEDGNSHAEAAGHADADAAELGGVDDAREEQCKVNVDHTISFGCGIPHPGGQGNL